MDRAMWYFFNIDAMARIHLHLTLLIAMATVGSLKAQKVTGVQARQDGNNIIISYQLRSTKFDQKYQASVWLSNDGGKTFNGPLKAVTGDVGEITEGGIKSVVWEVFKDDFDVSGNLVFDVRVSVSMEKTKKQFYAGYSGNTSAPFGFTVGQCGNLGWYLAGRFNLSAFITSTYESDSSKIINYSGPGYYAYNGKSEVRRYCAIVGFTSQVAKSVHIYIGAGYGSRELLWGIDEFSYADGSKTGENFGVFKSNSYSGLEGEIGLAINLGRAYISGGVSTLSYKRTDGVFSIGFVF